MAIRLKRNSSGPNPRKEDGGLSTPKQSAIISFFTPMFRYAELDKCGDLRIGPGKLKQILDEITALPA